MKKAWVKGKTDRAEDIKYQLQGQGQNEQARFYKFAEGINDYCNF